MKKKISKLLIMTMVASSMLVGCGDKKDDKKTDAATDAEKVSAEDVTAESLLNGVKDTVSNGGKYYDMDVTMDISAKIDTALILGAMGMGDQAAGAEGALMDLTMTGTINAKMDEDTVGMDGKVSVAMMGESAEEPVKSWMQKNSDDNTVTTYAYDSTSNAWTYTTSATESPVEQIQETADVKEIIDALKDCKVEAAGDGYTITGALDTKKMMDSASDSDVAGSMEAYQEIIDKLNIPVSIAFDKDKNLKSIDISVDKIEDPSFTLEKANIKITVNTLAGSDSLDVPEDVKSGAKEGVGLGF